VPLLVGGTGIINIVLAGVTERTCGIGPRQVRGARPNDVRLQSLPETVTLHLAGGLPGVLAGVGRSYAPTPWAAGAPNR